MKAKANQTMYYYCQLFGIVFNRKPSSEEIEKIITIANNKPINHPLKKLSINGSHEGGFELPLTQEHIDEFNNFNKYRPESINDKNEWLFYQIPNVQYQSSRQLRWNTSYGSHQLRVKDGLSWNREEVQSFVDICYCVGLIVKGCYTKYYNGTHNYKDYEYYTNQKSIDWEKINMINKYFTIRKIVIDEFQNLKNTDELKIKCDQLCNLIKNNGKLLNRITSSFSYEGGFSLPLSIELKKTFSNFKQKYKSNDYPNPYFDRSCRDYRFFKNYNDEHLYLYIYSNLFWSLEEINEFIEILTENGYNVWIDYSSKIRECLF
jgi:hypothetical protein